MIGATGLFKKTSISENDRYIGLTFPGPYASYYLATLPLPSTIVDKNGDIHEFGSYGPHAGTLYLKAGLYRKIDGNTGKVLKVIGFRGTGTNTADVSVSSFNTNVLYDKAAGVMYCGLVINGTNGYALVKINEAGDLIWYWNTNTAANRTAGHLLKGNGTDILLGFEQNYPQGSGDRSRRYISFNAGSGALNLSGYDYQFNPRSADEGNLTGGATASNASNRLFRAAYHDPDFNGPTRAAMRTWNTNGTIAATKVLNDTSGKTTTSSWGPSPRDAAMRSDGGTYLHFSDTSGVFEDTFSANYFGITLADRYNNAIVKLDINMNIQNVNVWRVDSGESSNTNTNTGRFKYIHFDSASQEHHVMIRPGLPTYTGSFNYVVYNENFTSITDHYSFYQEDGDSFDNLAFNIQSFSPVISLRTNWLLNQDSGDRILTRTVSAFGSSNRTNTIMKWNNDDSPPSGVLINVQGGTRGYWSNKYVTNINTLQDALDSSTRCIPTIRTGSFTSSTSALYSDATTNFSESLATLGGVTLWDSAGNPAAAVAGEVLYIPAYTGFTARTINPNAWDSAGGWGTIVLEM